MKKLITHDKSNNQVIFCDTTRLQTEAIYTGVWEYMVALYISNNEHFCLESHEISTARGIPLKKETTAFTTASRTVIKRHTGILNPIITNHSEALSSSPFDIISLYKIML